MPPTSFSRDALSLGDSVTHGTKALIDSLNAGVPEAERIIDLSIGTLDTPADARIDRAVREFVARDPQTAHAFAPVKGFPSLRSAVAARTRRLHGIDYDPGSEVIVTPGGIKGALTVAFHTFLDPGDEVVVPVPNWPHYGDMVKLHGATPAYAVSSEPGLGLSPAVLRKALSKRTKLLILGDCINPTGKVYSTGELRSLAAVVAQHNASRAARGASPVHVLFDCPYEAHVLGQRAKTFAALEGMRELTLSVTGPGKTYGMHGDRIGYVCASKETIAMMERVQVNLNSFASTYGQAAALAALQEDMDEAAARRAREARANLEAMADRLGVGHPAGGYFLFVDLSAHAAAFAACGYASADLFLLHEARVATIGGSHFAEGVERFRHHVRINCGRSAALLETASARMAAALSKLMAAA